MLGLNIGSSAASMPTELNFESQIITIGHSNGTDTPSSGALYNSGGGESNFTTLGASISGGSIAPTLSGTWNGLIVPASLIKVEVYTNIVAADIASAGAGKHIQFLLHQGRVVSAGSWSQAARSNVSNSRVNANGAAVASGGELGLGTFDIAVPGSGTTYKMTMGSGGDVPFNVAPGKAQLAAGTNYTVTSSMGGQPIAGPAHWSYQFSVDDDYPTKDYKFMIKTFVLL